MEAQHCPAALGLHPQPFRGGRAVVVRVPPPRAMDDMLLLLVLLLRRLVQDAAEGKQGDDAVQHQTEFPLDDRHQ